MKRLLFILLLIAAPICGGLVVMHSDAGELAPTAVLGEKPINGKMGNQLATIIPEDINTKQAKLMAIAYEKGKLAGFKNPELVQGLLLQETLAGGLDSYRVANPGPEAYFGPMQIKLAAAKDVLKRHPALFEKYRFHTRSDDEIKAFLILNDIFNIEVGARYLRILQTDYGYTGRELVNAYNRGPAGVRSVSNNFHYAIGAERKLAVWKSKRRMN